RRPTIVLCSKKLFVTGRVGTSRKRCGAGCERRARWRTPVVPAAGEAEPDGSLEPRSSGLPCAVPSGRPS
uniref:Uncharacterized protein n=1 Tax=Taeniopygia guttata TaxID=59729 RepID=A0A674HHB8_TAEGU